jgi:crotonobetainyl-CoA:carnitine CoA-transferase CaiB-like acyl-CoA transferase
MADVGAGLWAVIGALAALRARDRSGAGQHVDVSLFEAASPFGIYTLAEALLGLPASSVRGDGPLTGGVAVYGTYATRDDRSVAFAALEPKFLAPFFADHGLELAFDALAPGEHQRTMRAELTRIFAAKTAAEWRAYAEARDVCLEVVATPEEWCDDPHRLALAGDRDASKMPLPLGTPGSAPAPRQGQHSDAVLADAGVTPERIAALRAAGAIR